MFMKIFSRQFHYDDNENSYDYFKLNINFLSEKHYLSETNVTNVVNKLVINFLTTRSILRLWVDIYTTEQLNDVLILR